jgi:monofunctional biosynthetic peptidoglycan transglycosylase
MLAARCQATCLLAAAAWICFAMTVNANAALEKTLFDFSTVTNASAWQIVNDDVMGGVSTSKFEVTNGVAAFRGEVSLENNGGFASVRSLPARHDLAGCDAFWIRVRGDGRSYKFTARTARTFDSAIYQAVFKIKEGKWEELCLPLKEFVPTFRGRVLSGEPPLDPEKITSVGFLISDKQAGAFRLEIGWIKAVKLPHSQ